MKVRYLQQEKTISLPNSQSALSILHALWLNNAYDVKALCSGVGKCGKCKIRFLSSPPPLTKDEEALLTKEEIDTHIRLACKHSAKTNIKENTTHTIDDEISIDLYHLTPNYDFFSQQEINTIQQRDENIQSQQEKAKISLAIDFGTTTVEYTFLKNNIEIKSGSILNPMQGIGSEIMARLHFAQEKEQAEALCKRTWERIYALILENGYTINEIDLIVFSANSAMTYLALGKNSSNLAFAPYSLTYTGAQIEEITHNSTMPPLYIPPLFAPFVGGDISAGLYALEKTVIPQNSSPYPYLYIDMGTNAEFVLVLSENDAYIASVPLGPSLEGIGLSFGTVASPKSIIDFRLSPRCLDPLFLSTISNPYECDGICGVAYLHLLKILKNLSLIGDDGHFITNPQNHSLLAKKIAKFSQMTHSLVDILELPYNFYLSSGDVESILKVKAAFRTAFDMLLEEAKIPLQSLQKIYLAGTFGKYINNEALTALGFLPNNSLSKIQSIGNASLHGAKLLIDQQAQEEIKQFFQNNRHIELSNKEEFQQYYMDNFNFIAR